MAVGTDGAKVFDRIYLVGPLQSGQRSEMVDVDEAVQFVAVLLSERKLAYRTNGSVFPVAVG